MLSIVLPKKPVAKPKAKKFDSFGGAIVSHVHKFAKTTKLAKNPIMRVDYSRNPCKKNQSEAKTITSRVTKTFVSASSR